MYIIYKQILAYIKNVTERVSNLKSFGITGSEPGWGRMIPVEGLASPSTSLLICPLGWQGL